MDKKSSLVNAHGDVAVLYSRWERKSFSCGLFKKEFSIIPPQFLSIWKCSSAVIATRDTPVASKFQQLLQDVNHSLQSEYEQEDRRSVQRKERYDKK